LKTILLMLYKRPFGLGGLLFVFLIQWHTLHAQVLQFNNINCKVNADDRNLLEKMIKFEGNFYNSVYHTQKNDSLVININLYGKRREYNDVQKKALNTTFIDGYYSPMEKREYVYKNDTYMNIIVHETSHYILHNNMSNPPRWLNEGLATILGYLVERTDNQIYYLVQHPMIRQVQDTIRARTFSMQKFFTYQDADWYNEARRPMLYSTSYSIIYFLLNQDDKDYLSEFLILLQKGYSTQAVINKLFGNMRSFEGRFISFYVSGHGSEQ
jgi:hypothetical protein